MRDEKYWMGEALVEAQRALDSGEVPVGAVVVHRDQLVGGGHNRTEQTGSPIEHAEVVAIRRALETLGTKTLAECVLYSTVEPCVMCIGAAILARIPRVVFGAREPRTGACESVFSIPNEPALEHSIVVTGGIEAARAEELLRTFFVQQRREKRANGDVRSH